MFDDARLIAPADLAAGLAVPPPIAANLRRLRAVVEVARCRSVNRAAEHLHVTQSAVTRAVRALEDELGLPLFDRGPRCMALTEYGALIVERARRALGYLDAAEQELAAQAGAARRTCRVLACRVAQRHLQTVRAIADFQTETAAAQQLGISQPAVTLALRDLEEMLGTPLFERTPKGMVPTEPGEAVIRGAKLALNEIEAAHADLAAHLGQVRGRLVVGALPLSGTQIAPQAVSRVASRFRQLRLSLVEAHYDQLLKGLRCGDIDVIVGALHPNPPSDVVQERLFDDVLSVVARRGHPLAAREGLALEALAGAQWVVPYKRTGSRNTVEKALLAAGLSFPQDAIEANSVVLVRGLLMESDRLSVLSRRQIYYEEREGLLQVLPVELPGTRLPIGFITRRDAMSTPGLEALLAQLRSA